MSYIKDEDLQRHAWDTPPFLLIVSPTTPVQSVDAYVRTLGQSRDNQTKRAWPDYMSIGLCPTRASRAREPRYYYVQWWNAVRKPLQIHPRRRAAGVFCRTLNAESRVKNDSEPQEDPAYERGGDARWKFWIKPLKETDLGVAQHFLTPKKDHVKTQTIYMFLYLFACNPKRDLVL